MEGSIVLKPYGMLTMCQLELKKSKLMTVDKLQIEMNILRVKRSMIDYGVKENIEEEIRKAYEEICRLSCSCGNENDVNAIILRLQNLIESMKVTEGKK
jgi:hypothetical protein